MVSGLYDKTGKIRVRQGFNVHGAYWPDGALFVTDEQGPGIYESRTGALRLGEWGKHNQYVDVTSLYADNTALLAGLGSDLLAFWDADATSSLNLTSNAVNSWADLKQSITPSQGTGTSKPTYSATGWNSSKPSVSFDGGDGLQVNLAGQLPVGTTPTPTCEIWGLIQQDATSSTHRLIQWGSSLNGQNFNVNYFRDGNGQDNWNSVAGNGTVNQDLAIVGGASGQFIFRSRFEATRIRSTMYPKFPDLSSTYMGSLAAVPAGIASTAIRIGGSVSGGSNWLGQIRKLLVTKLLDDTKAFALQRYLIANQ